jgi:hypothetical protein
MRVALQAIHSPVFIPGLGQVATAMNPYSFAPTNATAPEAENPTYQCNWLENLFDPSGCASAATQTPPPPTLPNGGAPAVTFSTGSPLTGADGQPMNSSVAGTAANGETVYVNTPTATQQQVINTTSIQAQAQANAPVDCTQLWNQLTSAQCPCNYCSAYGSYVLIGAAVVLLILVLK